MHADGPFVQSTLVAVLRRTLAAPNLSLVHRLDRETSGVCLVAKRLEDGEFHWPRMQDGAMHLTAAQFAALFEGLDWKRVHAPSETRIPVKAG